MFQILVDTSTTPNPIFGVGPFSADDQASVAAPYAIVDVVDDSQLDVLTSSPEGSNVVLNADGTISVL